jgi:long-subunit acyl-CoA synthetase (AMP-forming)
VNELLAQLRQRAARSPRDAVLQGQDETVSARDLLQRIEQMARDLQAEEVGTVALYADNSPAWAVVDLACQLQGIRIVPVPTFFSRDQVAGLLQAAAVDLIVFDRSLVAGLPAQALSRVRNAPGLPGFDTASLTPGRRAQVPAGTHKITFTSGSTGNPKGVCLSSGQCLAVARSLLQAIGVAAPRHLSVLPLSTLLENISGLYMPLLGGGSSLLLAPGELGMQGSSGVDTQCFLDALESSRPHTMILVPQLLAVLDAALASGWKAPDSLRYVAVGGARVAPALLQRARARGLPVYEGYGLSESASVVSLNTPGSDRPGTCGRVLPHVQLVSHEGELVVSGNTFLGYLNQPDSWGAQAFATGDIGSVDADGYVTVSGRSKNVIITGFGRNVSPEWVESELQSVNLFHQAVVLGDGQPCCVALLLPFVDDLSDAAIQSALDNVNTRLPDYARIGRWLRLSAPLARADGLVTDNGRPRRQAIQARYQASVEQLFLQSPESLAL